MITQSWLLFSKRAQGVCSKQTEGQCYQNAQDVMSSVGNVGSLVENLRAIALSVRLNCSVSIV
jgi:hypothetical protein